MKKIIKIMIVLLILIGSVSVGAIYFIDDTVNILVYGLEGKRSDVMMLVMVDADKNVSHVISIPRDTYNPTVGHNGLGAKKQNAVYGFKEGGGPEGLVDSIENLVGVKIDHYVEIKYEGVKSVVDLLGGIPVDVPFDMVYDDPYATPPLHIDIKAGQQVLSGNDAMGFLRFRKSNDGKIREGDIQRIARQQMFLKSAAHQALTWKLPLVAKEGLEYVDTDLSSYEIIKLSLGLVGMTKDDVFFHMLPQDRVGNGDDGLSYVFHSKEGTAQLLKDIKNNVFKVEDPEESKE